MNIDHIPQAQAKTLNETFKKKKKKTQQQQVRNKHGK